MKTKPLSFSAYKKYHECPKKYDLHYNEKIRPVVTPAFFVFGSAVDKGANALLEGKTLEEALCEGRRELLRLLTEQCEYDERDYDSELIEDPEKLLRRLNIIGYPGDNADYLVSSLFQKLAKGEALSKKQQRCLNAAMYYSSLAKLKIILAGYQEQVLPRIAEVVSVQKEVKRGIMDAEVKMTGVNGLITMDNKTAYRLYEEDAVVTSVQLAGYGAEVGMYVVMDKNIKKNRIKTCVVCGTVASGTHRTCNADAKAERTATKLVKEKEVTYTIKVGDRCNGEFTETIQPEAVIQILRDHIPDEQRKIVEAAYQETDKAVAKKVFPMNLQSCVVWFGRKKVKCPYYDYCRSGKMDGLTKKEESDERKQD